MRAVLLALLLFPVLTHAQSIDEVRQAARMDALVQTVMSPEWFAPEDESGAEPDSAFMQAHAFYTRANQTYAAATHDALLARLDSIQPDDLAALAHPTVAHVDSAAWSALLPSGTTEELVAVMTYGEPTSSLTLADSVLVAEYLIASGLIERMATIGWLQQISPYHMFADIVDDYTEEELKSNQVSFMIHAYSLPVRYALRNTDPSAIEQATAAYRLPGTREIVTATIEGTHALVPYLNEVAKYEAGVADFSFDDPDAEYPTLQFPESEEGGGV